MSLQNVASYSTPYQYTGQELDSETGYYYYGARYYDPRIGVFLSVDPLTEKYPSISPYAYVANNPINMIDLDGRYIVPAAFANQYKNIAKYLQNK